MAALAEPTARRSQGHTPPGGCSVLAVEHGAASGRTGPLRGPPGALGLAVNGAACVGHVPELVQSELKLAMVLADLPGIEKADAGLLGIE